MDIDRQRYDLTSHYLLLVGGATELDVSWAWQGGGGKPVAVGGAKS